MSSLISTLQDIVGTPHVLTEGDLSAFQNDWRKRWMGRARAVVLPQTTDEVARVVRACALHQTAIVPQGGNTGLVGAGVPDDSGSQVVLSLQRMKAIRGLDAANLTMTVEAGCVLQSIQEAAQAASLLFPLSLAAEGSCTIGGNLATNAGGTQVLRFGNARDLCLGLEVVSAQGEVWNGLSGLRKDNTGYDLRNLFIGSEGTLGIITAATLKLFPAPRSTVTALVSSIDLKSCVSLLSLAQSHLGASLTGFEVMNQFSLELVAQHFPSLPRPLAPSTWSVLIEVSDTDDETQARQRFEKFLESALEQGLAQDAALSESLAQAKAMWHLRESIPLAQSEEGLNVKHDISLPISAIPDFVERTDMTLLSRFPGARLVNFGHLGDGNLHYNVQAPAGHEAAAFLVRHETEINQVVYDAVQAVGGSISAEHGVGVLKREELKHRKSPVALGMMHAIKGALDPHNLMNPGRLLDRTSTSHTPQR